jgi:hypothetical protein
MNIATRKPRRRRFDIDAKAAKLSRLKEQAPGLGGLGRWQMYAVMGSGLMLLTLVGLYYAMRIAGAAAQQREAAGRIEVAPAGQWEPTVRERLQQQIEQADAAAIEEVAAAESALREFEQLDLDSILGAEDEDMGAAGNGIEER